uniref:Retrovirus-related Pol polyprotein from transposon TNT 1-94 n=1 Tax=Cajanus cajan TaxID=3821 RepID=A0A151R004_CAJCA|nr:Retrovirus-related Pol polyprotein from transposon TNT 1-94 [Cajanus cajan]
MHTDICGSFDINSFGKEKYFIIFINDYSRYGYVYLLLEKSQAVGALEIYLDEVERKLDKRVKVVRSHRGGEYYGRYNETGQYPCPFAKILQKRGICAQCTMSSTPQQNGVSKRRNRTLMDIVRSMLSNSTLPIYLLMYALKIAMYLLNGYMFYCPNNSIVETGNARFIENGEVSGSTIPQKVEVKEVKMQVPLTYASSNKGTKCYMLTYRRPNHLKVIGYSDFDFARCVDSKRKNDKYSKGAKHMKLKYFVVKEKVHKQRVSIEHISTNLMIADPLTKGLLPKTFIEHVKNMGIIVTNDC